MRPALRVLARAGLALGRFALAALASVLTALAVLVCLASVLVLSALCLLAYAAWPYGEPWRWVDTRMPGSRAWARHAALLRQPQALYATRAMTHDGGGLPRQPSAKADGWTEWASSGACAPRESELC